MRRGSAALYLLGSAALLLFANGRNTVAIAAWLAPLVLLRFVRTRRPWLGLPLVCLVMVATWAFQFRGMVPVGDTMFWVIDGLYAVAGILPYLADRWAARRLPGLASTLVFPLTWVASEFLFLRWSPFSSWGTVGYTQYGNLPLIQIVAVTGLAGITFLVGWFAATVNWVWERGLADRRVRRGALCCLATLAGVFLLGGLRLALWQVERPTVRIAALSRPEASIFPNQDLERRFSGRAATAAETMAITAFWEKLEDGLLARADAEAAAGAKLVFWNEAALPVMKGDEARLVARGCRLARARRIYLGMAMGTIDPMAARWLDNKLVLIAPDGTVAWQYRKARPVPGGEAAHAVPSDGRLRTLDTPLGRLSTAICFDMDFPELLRQAGRAGAQVVLVPASDWPAIDPWHAQMAAFRAIEEGFSMVRQTHNGLSLAVDYQGHVLAHEDDLESASRSMVAEVPVAGARTPYALLGDLFAWCAVGAALVILILAARGAATLPEALAAPE
ncbi:MAG TPA: nitrilase-related carbon-nitrogen hydrolase [Thermoanaerobaculia bacterium]|nr:nitrilase-related carbon-nitrogen hydrolase [Thermoanaerobaculia bacterium]